MELRPFFPFFVMANTNFLFLLTLGKPETQTLGGSVIGSFTLGCVFTSYSHFTIFRNGRHQFSISVGTWKTGDPNFREVSNWKFHSRMYFGELWPFFPFSIMADTNFPFLLTLGKPETQT